MTAALVLSVLIALAGFLFASNATFGVALLAGACLLAIYGRILQANAHHREVLSAINRPGGATEPARNSA